MEVTVIAGKRENSQHFVISGLNQIYSFRWKSNGCKFVNCYHDACNARGKIYSDGLFHASEGKWGLHSEHLFTTSSVINFMACFNEMKELAKTSGKLPNVIYDEVMAKWVKKITNNKTIACSELIKTKNCYRNKCSTLLWQGTFLYYVFRLEIMLRPKNIYFIYLQKSKRSNSNILKN